MFALAIKLRVLSDDTQCHITMISEAPIRKDNPHMITLEKMLVDIYADKLISSTFNKAEYEKNHPQGGLVATLQSLPGDFCATDTTVVKTI